MINDTTRLSGLQAMSIFIIFIFIFTFMLIGWYSLDTQMTAINISIQRSASQYNRELTTIEAALAEIQTKNASQSQLRATMISNLLSKLQDLELKIAEIHLNAADKKQKK